MLTTKEISELLQVSEETVRRWIRTKELQAKQEGKSYLVDEQILKDFIEKKSKEPGTSLSKFSSILGGVGGIIANPILVKGIAGAGAARVAHLKNLRKKESDDLSKSSSKMTIQDIDYQINSLNRKKKKLELEYQMELLKIDDELAKYQKLRDQYSENN